MPKRAKKEHDFAVNAFRVVEHAIGEHMDGSPLVQESRSVRSESRLKRIPEEHRKAIAQKAAKARWAKKD